MKPGERGRISGFSLENAVTRQLMTLGLVENAEIEFLRTAPTGDPIEIKVMGYALSLRRSDADLVLVEPSVS
jgi:ferrous iron transport protein A